jgi:hypothetical protein
MATRNQVVVVTRKSVQRGGYIEKLWRQRPDRMAINHDKRIIHIIEFKRTLDLRPKASRRKRRLGRITNEWLAETLTEVGTKSDWKVQMIVSTDGTMGFVEIEKFENNLKALDVEKKEWTHIRKLHARALLEAHDEVLRAYYEILYASQAPKTHRRHHVTSDVYM